MKEKPSLDRDFWNTRWENHQTGWDTGRASPAIAKYADQLANKNIAILIPGCGNAYEAEYLARKGFLDITLVDIAPKAVSILKEKFKNIRQVQVFCEDFFQHCGKYDLILEQTFFCALPPEQRDSYAEKAASLLKNQGRIVGLLFDREFDRPGPPFGGSEVEYRKIFMSLFTIRTMGRCYSSIPERAGSELFINLIKK